MLSTENERITTLSIQRLSQIEELRINNNEESLKLEVYELRGELERVKSNSYVRRSYKYSSHNNY